LERGDKEFVIRAEVLDSSYNLGLRRCLGKPLMELKLRPEQKNYPLNFATLTYGAYQIWLQFNGMELQSETFQVIPT
jgi:hypothetical protein